MARTVCYQLYSSTLTATSASLATADILRPGKIIGWVASVQATGGAGIGTLLVSAQLNTNGTSVNASNNPMREAPIGGVNMFTPNATANAAQASLAGLSIPVSVGDRLNLSAYNSGTAAASGTAYFWIYVHEE